MKLSLRCQRHRSFAFLAVLLTTSLGLLWLAQPAPAQLAAAAAKRPLTHNDYEKWRTIQVPLISPDGNFAAYTLVTPGGDSEIVVRDLREPDPTKQKEYRYKRGSGGPGGGKGGAGAAKGGKGADNAAAVGGKVAFTDDSKRLLFAIAPTKGAAKKAEKDKEKDKDQVKDKDAPLPSMGIMTLADGKVKVIPGVRNFQLPETSSGGVAYHKASATSVGADKIGGFDDDDGDDDDMDDFDFLQVKGKKGGGGKQGQAGAGAPTAKATPTDLVLHKFDDGSETTIADVTDFTLSRDGAIVVCAITPKDAADAGVNAYLTPMADDKAAPLPLVKGKAKYSRFTWDESQRYLAFFADHSSGPKEPGKIALHLWDRRNLKMPENGTMADEVLSSTNTAGLKDGCILTDRAGIKFSDDASKIVLAVAPPQAPADDEVKAQPGQKDGKVIVELWHWKDDFIQPMQKAKLQQEKNRTFTSIYHVKTKKLVQLADKTMPVVNVAADGGSALGTDDHPYRALVAYDGNYADHYLISTSDGRRKPLIKKHHGNVTFSPTGKNAIFYDGKDWNTIALPGGTITNLTKKIEKAKFFNEDFDSPSTPPAYGIAGWSSDERFVFLYDKYDIWEFGVRGTSHRNLTGLAGSGDAKIQLRYHKLDSKEKGINMSKPMFLRLESLLTRATGFTYWDPSASQLWKKPFVEPLLLNALAKAKYGNKLLFTAQSFYHFPDLFVVGTDFVGPAQVSRANPEKDGFNWGKAELVRYQNADGVMLSGVLIKPENFDDTKKYPMIVYIYEKLSQNVHHFVVPKEGTSINPTYYASNGYLVFMPDIVYTVGYPGQSALKCVLPGIQAVVNGGFVQEDAIGIQGHSWGGYQIAYMVTQTGRFKAAAAGAAVSNMTSAYDGIRWGTGLPRQFQYEKTQSRIGGTLWEYPMRFVENSPVFMADRVKTPLMLLNNDQDDAVPWYQGIEYYLALRRLGKEVYMFNYPGELHGLKGKANQKDFTIRMQQFFDHHLKGAEMPAWMKSGIPYTPRGPVKDLPAGGGEG